MLDRSRQSPPAPCLDPEETCVVLRKKAGTVAIRCQATTASRRCPGGVRSVPSNGPIRRMVPVPFLFSPHCSMVLRCLPQPTMSGADAESPSAHETTSFRGPVTVHGPLPISDGFAWKSPFAPRKWRYFRGAKGDCLGRAATCPTLQFGDCPNFRVSENGTVPFDAGMPFRLWHDRHSCVLRAFALVRVLRAMVKP